MNAGITKTLLSTQRTGAISRMVDLGLVAREKSGLRGTYLVTQPGKSFQNQTKR
jgi:predicted transcriptional regulator